MYLYNIMMSFNILLYFKLLLPYNIIYFNSIEIVFVEIGLHLIWLEWVLVYKGEVQF